MKKRLLFQGDSITDFDRGNYEDCHETGKGYVRLLEADLTFGDPMHYEILNGGVTGNRVVDLLARWKKDCLNLCPDVLTILVGVNDVWHELASRSGVDASLFEKVYRILLEETRKHLPDTRIILMGPYLFPGTGTKDSFEVFSREVSIRREITRGLAEEYHLDFIDLQKAFNKALKRAPAEYWLSDGVHPTAAGHKLIAETWKCVGLKEGGPSALSQDPAASRP